MSKLPMKNKLYVSRRSFMNSLALLPLCFFSNPLLSFAQTFREPKENKLLKKPIPSTKEELPVIGMGTWVTFNVGPGLNLRNQRAEVLNEFFK